MKSQHKETHLDGESHFYKLLTAQLNKYGYVELDGIVKIQRKFIPASFDQENGLLRPPKGAFTAQPIQSFSRAFQSAIEGLQEEHPFKMDIMNHFRGLQKQWLEDQKIHLKGIGTLTKQETGLHLELSDDIDSFFDHFPELQISILEKKSRISEPASAPSSSMLGKRIEGIEKNTGISSYILPLTLLLAGMIAVVFVFKYFTRNADPESGGPSKNEIFKREDDDIAPFQELGETQIFENQLINKYQDILSKEILDEGCEIVVGSFTASENAEQFALSLTTDGYVTKIRHENDITRVVIVFDCASRDLVDYLVEIRIKLNDKAWLLKPLYDPFKDSIY